jgi:hypothetical protein
MVGIIGVVLSILMVGMGTWTAIGVAARFQSQHIFLPHGISPVAFLAIQLGMLLQFARSDRAGLSVQAQIRNTQTSHAACHHRLTAPSDIAASFGRLRAACAPYLSSWLAELFIVVAVLRDVAKMRRIHPVCVWGGLATVAWMYARAAIGQTEI